MNNIPTTGELFATNQVSANTERCYKLAMELLIFNKNFLAVFLFFVTIESVCEDQYLLI